MGRGEPAEIAAGFSTADGLQRHSDFLNFCTLLLWVKNRAWVAGRGDLAASASEDDRNAHEVRNALGTVKITAAPWALSLTEPRLRVIGGGSRRELPGQSINHDFRDMTAGGFFNWLRDALAHGDARTIRPLPAAANQQVLAGFEIRFSQRRGSARLLTLSLYEGDMRRLGSHLADQFCRTLAGADRYSETDSRAIASAEAKAA